LFFAAIRLASTGDDGYLSPCGRERIFLVLAQLTLGKSKRGDRLMFPRFPSCDF
jgi:hypothetical protein